ncbi:hypothetical protein EK21DRAFT_72183, partial [Setomelanomma holmii]
AFRATERMVATAVEALIGAVCLDGGEGKMEEGGLWKAKRWGGPGLELYWEKHRVVSLNTLCSLLFTQPGIDRVNTYPFQIIMRSS